MKLLSAIAVVFLLTSMAPAQSPSPNPKDNGLELRLQAEDLDKGVPDAFTFTLLNASDHDIRLPQPAIECEDPLWDGHFSLKVNFKPLPGGKGSGRACTNDRIGSRPIMERVKDWKTLDRGESIAVRVSKKRLFFQNAEAGTYEFRAFYNPPVMTQSDRELLRQLGIIFPEKGLSTAPITFVKQP
jgi:hypothetical protein